MVLYSSPSTGVFDYNPTSGIKLPPGAYPVAVNSSPAAKAVAKLSVGSIPATPKANTAAAYPGMITAYTPTQQDINKLPWTTAANTFSLPDTSGIDLSGSVLPQPRDTVVGSVFGNPSDTSNMQAYYRFAALNPPVTAPFEISRGIGSAISSIGNIGSYVALGIMALLLLSFRR